MARLPQGVTKRKDGLYQKRFTIDGRRISVYARSIKELQEKEAAKRADLKETGYKKNAKITMDEYYSEWIKMKERSVKPATIGEYKIIYEKHISPHIGREKVLKLEKRAILLMTETVKESLGSKRANAVLMIAKSILAAAEADEIITRNPAETIKPYQVKKSDAVKNIHRALTEEEQAVFLEAIKESYYREMVELMLATGIRVGEAGALQWQDVDLKNNVLHIRRTISKDESGKRIISETTKTETGERDIPINSVIKAILRRQKDKAVKLYGLAGIQAEKLVFRSIWGGIVYSDAIGDVINKAIATMNKQGYNIEHFSPHALRDTFATTYSARGGSMQVLKSLLGHSSYSMTADLYSHVLPNLKATEMEKIQVI